MSELFAEQMSHFMWVITAYLVWGAAAPRWSLTACEATGTGTSADSGSSFSLLAPSLGGAPFFFFPRAAAAAKPLSQPPELIASTWLLWAYSGGGGSLLLDLILSDTPHTKQLMSNSANWARKCKQQIWKQPNHCKTTCFNVQTIYHTCCVQTANHLLSTFAAHKENVSNIQLCKLANTGQLNLDKNNTPWTFNICCNFSWCDNYAAKFLHLLNHGWSMSKLFDLMCNCVLARPCHNSKTETAVTQ